MSEQWVALVDKNSGRTYYYNKAERLTTWTKPEGFNPSPAADANKPSSTPLPSDSKPSSELDENDPGNWVEMVDKKSGRKYYFNKKTRTTTWKAPECLLSSASNTDSTPTSAVPDAIPASAAPTASTASTTSASTAKAAPTPIKDDTLPPGWLAYADAQTGRTYWFNKTTRETTWHRPQHATAVATPLVAAGSLPPVPQRPANKPTVELPATLPTPSAASPKPQLPPAVPVRGKQDSSTDESANLAEPTNRGVSLSTNILAGARSPTHGPKEPEDEESKALSSSTFIELDEEAERALFAKEESNPEENQAEAKTMPAEDSDDDEEVIAAKNRAKERSEQEKEEGEEGEDAQPEGESDERLSAYAADQMMNLKMTQQERTLELFTNDSDSEDENSSIRFAKHRKGLFARIFRTKSAIQGTDTILSFKKSLIKKALLKQNRELDTECIQSFKNIMSYMGDRSSSKGMIDHAKKMIRNLMIAPAGLRDESFIQLCKQTNNHPKVENCAKGWELMSLCLAAFPPSKTIRSFLVDYISKTLEDPKLPPAVKDLARTCQSQVDRIVEAGQRKQVPSEREIEAIRKGSKVTVSIPLLNGTSTSYQVDSYTTVTELEEQIFRQLGLVFTEPFALFEMGAHEVERLLESKERVLDVVASWEHDRPDSETSQVGSKHAAPYVSKYNRFLFKAKLVLKVNVPEVTADPEALNLLFIQAANDVTSARYAVKQKHAVVLGALHLQATKGDMPEGYTADALCDIIHEFLPDGLVHNERHKVVRPLAMDWSHKILSKWGMMKGFTKYESQLNYLQVAQEWTFYGASLFSVEQRQFKDYPDVFLVGITCEGILIMHPEKRTVLENYPYPDVLTWGFSDEKFIFTVGNLVQQRRLVFKTSEGRVMHSLVHDYVKFKVRARATTSETTEP